MESGAGFWSWTTRRASPSSCARPCATRASRPPPPRTGREALGAAASFRPDLVLLDVMLPDIDGFEVHRRLTGSADAAPAGRLPDRPPRDRRPHPRAHDRRRRLRGQALQPGGADRPGAGGAAPHPRRGGRRRAWCSRTWSSTRRRREVRRAGALVELTPTEFSLLRYLLANAGRVLSKAQILDHVWNYDFGGDSNVVETYISYLRKKVDRSGEPLIHTVRGFGYSLRLRRGSRAPCRCAPACCSITLAHGGRGAVGWPAGPRTGRCAVFLVDRVDRTSWPMPACRPARLAVDPDSPDLRGGPEGAFRRRRCRPDSFVARSATPTGRWWAASELRGASTPALDVPANVPDGLLRRRPPGRRASTGCSSVSSGSPRGAGLPPGLLPPGGTLVVGGAAERRQRHAPAAAVDRAGRGRRHAGGARRAGVVARAPGAAPARAHRGHGRRDRGRRPLAARRRRRPAHRGRPPGAARSTRCWAASRRRSPSGASRSARLRQFVGDASHELQTPLTSVRGYAELFRRGAAQRPDDLETAMRADRGGGRRAWACWSTTCCCWRGSTRAARCERRPHRPGAPSWRTWWPTPGWSSRTGPSSSTSRRARSWWRGTTSACARWWATC